MVCLLTIHHSMLHTLPIRMSTTLHLYLLRANNPNQIMHMSLNPWGRHMKHHETTILLTLNPTSDMPLRGKQLVVYPYQTLWEALSITHNHNPYILWWKDCLLPWWKGKNSII